tara:strand:- start:1969 stop:2265 length:297 start_codon:yes stop_codon:yes gene_type:complete
MGANFTENTPKAKFPNLETVVARQMWPTPLARDCRIIAGAARPKGAKGSEPLAVQVGLEEGTMTGALNPTWVEWLMGFPLEWTVSKVWEMRSSRKSQK